MLSKIYIGLLAIAVIVMSILTFYANSWLSSVSNPEIVAQNYQNTASMSWTALWIAFIALIVFANVILWMNRKAWPLWASLVFFAVFVIVQTFWLDQSFFSFQKENGLNESSFLLTPVLGVAVCIAAAIGIFFDQFLVLRMRDKMFGTNNEAEEEKPLEEKA